MATPILLTDVNANFIPRVGAPFNIHIRDYQLGEHQTIEALSLWEFSETELSQVLETGLVFLRFFEFQPPVCLFNAGITEFEGQNVIYRHADCLDLPSFTREIEMKGEYLDEITSAWRLNETGIDWLKENGYVAISIVGGMTDVQVFGESPVVHIEKGEKYGECNRKACCNNNARFFNHSTKKYYCTPCAQTINYHNHADALRMFGHQLCTIDRKRV